MTARRAFVTLGITCLVLVVVLVLTGLWLSFRYEPRGIFLGSNSQAIGRVESHVDPTRTLHRFAAFAIVPLLAAFAVSGGVAALRSRRVATAATGVLLVALGLAAAIGGHRLAWSQVGVWSTASSRRLDLRGVWLSDALVRFAIIGRRVVPIDDFRREAWLHVTLVPAVLVLTGAGLALLVRTPRRPG